MKTTFLLCLCVAVATAITVWPAGQQRTYLLNIRHGVGQPEIEKNFALLLLRAKVIVQAVTPQTLLVKIKEPSVISQLKELYNGFIKTKIPGWQTPGPFSGQTSQVSHKWMEVLTESPIKVNLNSQGEVNNFEVQKDVDTHVVNIYRSIISALQVTSKIRDLEQDSPDIFNPRNHYKSMEEHVEGECSNTYEWIPLSDEVVSSDPLLIPVPEVCSGSKTWEIVKTTNFSNCEELPTYDFGLPARTECEPGAASCGTFWTRSSVTRYTACSAHGKIVIQKILDTNKVAVNPLIISTEKSVAISVKNFTLISAGPISSPISMPSNVQKYSSLVYDFNEATELVKDASASPVSSKYQVWDRKSGFSKVQNFHSYGYDRQWQRLPVYTTWEDIEDSDESDSESDESDSDEDVENQQPLPTLAYPPLNPLLPFFVGFEGDSIKTKINIPNALLSLIQTVAEESMDPSEMPEKNTLNKVQIAVRLARVASLKQLEAVAKVVYEVGSSPSRKQQAAKKFFRDIVAMAGTNPSFMMIKELILRNELKGIKAAMVLATLPKSLRTPTVELLEQWLDLVQQLSPTRSRQLKITAVLALARLVNNVCVHPTMRHNRYPVHAFGFFCSPNNEFIISKLIPYLAQKLQQSSDSRWQMTFGRALTLIGHEAALPALERILEGKRNDVSDTVRAVIVLSMKPMVVKNPKLMNHILMKIYHNTDDDYVVRSAAFVRLMNKDVSLTVLQRIASSTWWEPNIQVETLVKSTLKSLDKENLPHSLRLLSKKAAQVTHLLRPTIRGIQRSHTWYHSNQLKNPKVGLVTKTTWIGSDDSIYPTAFIHAVRKHVGGLNLQPYKVTAILSSPSDWYDEIDDILDDTDDDSSSSDSDENDSPAEKILEQLGITEDETEDLEGFVNVKLNNVMDYTMPFNNETLYEIVNYIRRVESDVASGQSFNFQKLVNRKQITVAVPSGLGLPVVFTLATPTIVIVRGSIQADATPDLSSADEGELKVPDQIDANGKIEVLVSKTKIAKLSIVDIVESDLLITGVNKEVHTYLPVQFSLKADLDDENMILKVKPLKTNPELVLFNYDVEPYVAVKDIEDLTPASDVKQSDTLEVRDKPLKKTINFGKKYTGLDFEFEQETDGEFLDLESYMNVIRQKSPMGLLSIPFASNTVRNTEVSLTLKTQSSETNSITIAIDHDEDETPSPTYTAGDPTESSEEKEYRRPQFKWQDIYFQLDSEEDSDSSSSSESDSSNSESNSESNSSSDESLPQKRQSKYSSMSFARTHSFEKVNRPFKSWKWSPYQQTPSSHAEPLSQARRQFVLKKLLHGTKASEADILDMYIGFESDHTVRQYALTLASSDAITDDDNNEYAVFLSRGPLPREPQPFEVCIQAVEDPADLSLFDVEDILKDDPTSKIQMSVSFGKKCGEGTEIDIKAVMRQSYKREKMVEKSPVVKQCRKEMANGYTIVPACRNATYLAGLTDEILISARWNRLHPIVANVSRQVVQLAQNKLWSQTSIQHLDLIGQSNPSGKAQVHVQFHPKLHGANVTVSTPKRNVFFRNLRIPHHLRPVLPYHPTYDWDDRYYSKITKLQYTPFCQYDDDKVYTFDNVTYKYDLGNNYHLLVADTSEDGEDIAVLAKDDEKDNKVLVVYSDDMEVKISTDVGSADEDIDSADDFDVVVDGKPIDIDEDDLYVKKDEDGEEILYVYALKGGVMVVELPDKDITILHNGDGLAISFDNSYRDDVSGLCGNFDGEPVGEFETASGCVVSSAQQFASSYQLGPQARAVVRSQSRSKFSSCAKAPRYYADVIDQLVSSYATSCSNTKTRVYHQGGNVCFSEVPITECGVVCEPSEVFNKEINFHCLPQGRVASMMLEKVRSGKPVVEFSGKEKSFSRHMNLPRGCVNRRG